jgi:hypothetical protein
MPHGGETVKAKLRSRTEKPGCASNGIGVRSERQSKDHVLGITAEMVLNLSSRNTGYPLFPDPFQVVLLALWKVRYRLGMVKLRLYVARVKTHVLHIVVQLLILCDSYPNQDLTNIPVWASCFVSCGTDIFLSVARLENCLDRQVESTKDETWGQFRKMVQRWKWCWEAGPIVDKALTYPTTKAMFQPFHTGTG